MGVYFNSPGPQAIVLKTDWTIWAIYQHLCMWHAIMESLNHTFNMVKSTCQATQMSQTFILQETTWVWLNAQMLYIANWNQRTFTQCRDRQSNHRNNYGIIITPCKVNRIVNIIMNATIMFVWFSLFVPSWQTTPPKLPRTGPIPSPSCVTGHLRTMLRAHYL